MTTTKTIPACPEALVLDFDGVILESTEIKTGAFRDLFAHLPQHLEDILGYHQENLGLSRYRKFEWVYETLLGEALTPLASKRLGERFSRLVLDKTLRCPMVPGALDLLALASAHCTCVIVSGTPQQELEVIVSRRSLDQYFAEVWGSPPGKEETLEDLLRRLVLDPNEVIFVGDGISDYQAAVTVGLHFIARKTPDGKVDWQSLDVPTVADLGELGQLLRFS